MKLADLDLIDDLFVGCMARTDRVDERLAAEREIIANNRAVAVLLAEWDETKHPRQPGGVDERGGEFAPGEGGGEGGAGPIDPRVTDVGGDEWNKQTALRLEKEYQKAKPDLEAILEKGLGETVGGEDDESSGAPTTWDDLTSDQQEKAEQDYVENNFDQEQQYQFESWQESADHEDIKEAIQNDADWLGEKMKAYYDDEDTELDTKLDADQLARAAIVNDDGSLDWDYTYLASLSSYDTSPEFPGFVPPTDEELALQVLPQETRDEISTAMKSEFKDEVKTRVENTDVSDVIDDSYVKESLAENFSSMDDDEKFNYAKKGLDEEGFADFESPTTISTLKMPSNWETINAEGSGYAATRVVGTYVSQNRALELMTERGIDATISGVQRMDSSIWQSWKSDSASNGGKALQLAAAQELGGRVQYEDSEIASIIRTADSDYSYAGGYLGVKAYVRAKWETSQFLLDKADMPTLPIYRGIIVSAKTLVDANAETVVIPGTYPGTYKYTKLTDYPLDRNGAQSGSANKSIANAWNGVGVTVPDPVRVVLRVDAPRTAVLSLPVYGQNIHREEEIVFTGTAWKKWDAFQSTAPDVTKAPIMKLIRFIRAMIKGEKKEKKGGLVGPGPGLRKKNGEWVFGISVYEEDLKLGNWLNEYRDGTHRSKKPPVHKPLPKKKS